MVVMTMNRLLHFNCTVLFGVVLCSLSIRCSIVNKNFIIHKGQTLLDGTSVQHVLTSVVECARYSASFGYVAFTYKCNHSIDDVTCSFKGNYLSSYVGPDPEMCYAIDKEFILNYVTTGHTPSVAMTLPTTSIAPARMVKGAVGYVLNFCSVSSGYDILVVTSDETVYFYDQADSLSIGPCKIDTFWNVFPNSPITAAEIDCLLLYNVNELNAVAGTNVHRWQASSASLNWQTSLSFNSAFNVAAGTNLPVDTTWCSVMWRSTQYYAFHENSGYMHRYSQNNPNHKKMLLSDNTQFDQNSYQLNQFYSVPANAVAVGYTINDYSQYVVITDDMQYHVLTLDFSNALNPTATLNSGGPIQF